MEILTSTHRKWHNIHYGLLIGEWIDQEYLESGQPMHIGNMPIMDLLVELVEEWIWIGSHEILE